MRARLPDLELLDAFSVLVEEGSVTRAAQRLGLSQPAASHCLSRLRRLFDDPLLVRGGGGLMPTRRALELVPEVAALLERARALAVVRESFDPERSQLAVSLLAPAYVGSLLSVPLAVRMAHEAPGMSVRFVGRADDVTSARLLAGDVDFQLGWWERPPAQLHCRSLFSEELVCLVARDDPRFDAGIDVAGFLSARHARIHQVDRSFATSTVDRAVEALGASLSIALHAPNPFALASAVAQARLVGTVSTRLARQLAALFAVRILPLPFETPQLRVALYWHHRTHAEASHRWMRAIVADVARGL